MEFSSPRTIEEAINLTRKWKGKSTLIAGGTNVIPDIRAGAIRPEVLIDLSHLKKLSYVKEDKKKVRIGALTTISELASSEAIRKSAPILCEAAGQIGNPLVRNRATIAGNLAHASPAADSAVPLLALEAIAVTDWRQIPVDRFFLGPNQTVLKPGEMIREVIFPRPDRNARMAYIKLGLRNAMAISVVSMAILMEMEGRECKKARIGLGAVAPTPVRAYGTEEMLTGKEVTSELIEAFGNHIEEEVRPITDIRAHAEYRTKMVSVLLRRLIQETAQ